MSELASWQLNARRGAKRGGGKLVSPARSRRDAAARGRCVQHVQRLHRVSERRVLGQPRTTQRYAAGARSDEDSLTASIIRLASRHGAPGYIRSDQ